MFDPNSFVVGGVSLLVLVFGLVEFVKAVTGWEGQRVTLLAAFMGAIVLALYQITPLLQPVYGQVYEIIVTSVAFGLSASGYYKFAAARLPKFYE